jgi:hypothetical protein
VGTYNIDEAAFELPGVWEDKTVHILSTPAPDGSNYGLIINRASLAEGQSLGAFVEKHLTELSRMLRGYELIGQRESVIGGLPATEAKLTWINDGRAIFHYMAVVAYGGLVVIFTASSLAKYAESCEQLMSELLPTLRFRER